MVDDRLADLVRRAFGGEVLGGELFRRLAAEESDPARRRRLFAAQLLEEQTRDAAEALAAELGVLLDDGHADREAGRRASDVLAGMSWPDRMRAVAEATGTYRQLYGEMGALLPDPAHPAVLALLAHERALNAFAAVESAGRSDSISVLLDALDPSHRTRFDALAPMTPPAHGRRRSAASEGPPRREGGRNTLVHEPEELP